MSDAAWLDKCRADLLRSRTACENQKHIIIDLSDRLAAAEADAARYRWIISSSSYGITERQQGVLYLDRSLIAPTRYYDLDAAIDAARGAK